MTAGYVLDRLQASSFEVLSAAIITIEVFWGG